MTNEAVPEETLLEELVPGEVVLLRTDNLKELAKLGEKYGIKSIELLPFGQNGIDDHYIFNLLCCVKRKEVSGIKKYSDTGKITMVKLRELVGNSLFVNENELTPDTRLYDLPIDSLDLIQLIINLENELGIEISDRELDKQDTFGDIVELLKSQDILTDEQQPEKTPEK